MRLLAASSITFTDLSDASGAMLTSDVLLVPCDSAGVPKLALGSSPLTSRMIILQGGIEQTGWSFSRTQQGVTSSVDSSGVVSVTAISADNGFVEITASKPGQASLIKKLTVSKVYQGETGSLASDFSIELSPAAFQISSRGMVMEAQVITATCRKVNIAGSPAISWTADGVQISSTTDETVAITIEASVMLASFTIGCTVAGYGTKSLVVQGIRNGTPKPLYLGLLASAPSDTPEGPLLYNPGLGGDYYLGTDMIPYWYDGTSFTSEGLSYVPNYADIMSRAAAEALKVPNTIPVTSALYAYFDHMSVTNAYIDGLRTRALKLAGGGSIQSEQYIENQLGFLLKADGTFNAVNANLINAIISGSGTFKGIIDSLPLKTTTQSEAGTPVAFNVKTHWSQTQLDNLLSGYSLNVIHAVTGAFDGVGITNLMRTTGNVTISHLSASYGYNSGIAYNSAGVPAVSRSYTAVGDGTLSIGLRSRRLSYMYSSSDGSGYSYALANEIVRLYKNGSLVATHTNINSTMYYNVSVSRGDVILITAEGGASVTYDYRDSVRTGWATPEAGYTLYMYINQSFSGAGTWLVRNGTWMLLNAGYFYANTLTVAGNTPSKTFAKALDFVAGVGTFTINELKTASGTIIYNSHSYQVIGVMKTSATSMTVFHDNGSLNFSLPDGDPGTSGYYDASGTYSVIASVAGAEMMNVNAREADTYSIGNIKRFFQIIGKNVICDTLTAANTDEYKHSQRDFASGTLVYTSIDYSQENGDSWVLEIKGNSYGATKPFFAAIQGYIYSNAVINYGGWSIGSGFSNIIVTNLGGKLCFWWPRMQYWQGFAVLAYVAHGDRIVNRVTSIVNSADPGGTKRVSIALSTQ